MRLLVVTQHYWPEPFNFSDICEELVSRGHDVTVLTGVPNYPEGVIYPGYESAADTVEVRNAVRILRTKLHPRKSGAIHRVWNYYSFSHNATKAIHSISDDYDVVLSFQTSPVMMAKPAIAASSMFGIPLLLWCIDIWPECLTAGGIKHGSAVFEYYRRVSKRVYGAADVLAVTSPAFESYLRDEVGVETQGWLYLPQYAEDLFSSQTTDVPEGYDSSKFNVTFAGNIGSAQSVITAVRAAAVLGGQRNVVVHIVGSGSELERCRSEAESSGACNVVFHGRRGLDEMPAYYQASDAMLITFANEPALALTLPRKVQSYLAASKPVIGSVSGEARRVIEEANCGMACDPEDFEGLAIALAKMSELPQADLNAMSKAARKYYDDNYTKEGFFSKLETRLQDLKEKGNAHPSAKL